MKALMLNIASLDHLLISSVNNWAQKRKLVNKLFYLITISGDGYLYPVLTAILILINFNLGTVFLKVGLLAYAIELPLYLLIKNGTKRKRPFDFHKHIVNKVSPPDKFSFPSGHTSAAFVFATLISLMLPALAPSAYIWAVLVGISRVYLGVHFPTDILAGTVLGMLSTYVSFMIIF
jgi:undecaprenyl-diphosphatase